MPTPGWNYKFLATGPDDGGNDGGEGEVGCDKTTAENAVTAAPIAWKKQGK